MKRPFLAMTFSIILCSQFLPFAHANDLNFASKGRILGPSDVSQPAGDNYGTADVTSIELPDGRIRLYFGWMDDPSKAGRVASAISSDGINFKVEPGIRMESAGSPFVYALPTGGYRMYYTAMGIKSAFSSDGLNFTAESGERIAVNTFVNPIVGSGFFPVCTAIVPIEGNKYRMYCRQQVPGGPIINGASMPGAYRAIFSATSSDLINWTPESGRRIGPDSFFGKDADHPTLISVSGASVSIAFDSISPGLESEIYIADSQDGLTFTSSHTTGILGNEVSYLKTKNGNQFLYFGRHTPAEGSTIHVGVPGAIDYSNQTKLKKIKCYRNPAITSIAATIEIAADDPVCPKDYSENPYGPFDGKSSSQQGAASNGNSITCYADPKLKDAIQVMIITGTNAKCPPDYSINKPSGGSATASPKPTPKPSVSSIPKKITITCVKGKLIKKVSAVNPKCPPGYKRK